MVNKKTIGKIQLGVGIDLFIISIVGIIIGVGGYIGNSSDIINFLKLNFAGYPTEIDALAIILFKINILVASIVLFIISILFVTQSMINLKD